MPRRRPSPSPPALPADWRDRVTALLTDDTECVVLARLNRTGQATTLFLGTPRHLPATIAALLGVADQQAAQRGLGADAFWRAVARTWQAWDPQSLPAALFHAMADDLRQPWGNSPQ